MKLLEDKDDKLRHRILSEFETTRRLYQYWPPTLDGIPIRLKNLASTLSVSEEEISGVIGLLIAEKDLSVDFIGATKDHVLKSTGTTFHAFEHKKYIYRRVNRIKKLTLFWVQILGVITIVVAVLNYFNSCNGKAGSESSRKSQPQSQQTLVKKAAPIPNK